MTQKTNLKYSRMKLKALFAGVIVAAWCCVGLFASSIAIAESTVQTNDVNEVAFSSYYNVTPSGADSVSGANFAVTETGLCGLSGYSSLYYQMGPSDENGVHTICGASNQRGQAFDFKVNWNNTEYFKYYSIHFSLIDEASSGSSGKFDEILSGNNSWSDYWYFKAVTAWPCFKLDVKGASAINISSESDERGTVVISGEKNLTHVYGDGTDSNSTVTLAKVDGSNSYTLTVHDPNSLTVSGTTTITEDKSDVYTITPASGYTFKDVAINSKTSSEKLDTLDDSKLTYNIAWPSNIVVEFAENPTYTATLDANGGTISGSKTISGLSEGAAMTTLDSSQIPVLEGHTFLGYFDISGTQYYYADGTSAHVWDKTSDATLYAHWAPTIYEVTLNLNGGTGSTVTIYPLFGEDMPTLDKADLPTKEGYTFEGFYDGEQTAETSGLIEAAYADDATVTKYYNADGTSAHVWDKAEDATLYAHWTKNADPTPTPTPDNGSAATTGTSASTSTQTGDSSTIYSILAACMGLVALGVFARNGYRKRGSIRNRKH